ncbi:aspartic peptidase domain-containing protein [Mycena epipterygia]|nr:aspartic peptidase domain-containing protein [Mycena epipterygia]
MTLDSLPYGLVLAPALLSLNALSAAHPIQRNAGVITLPLRRYDALADVHPELRHQQQINRANRLLARSTGLAGPSDAELRRNLERTLFNLRARNEIPSHQLYSIDGTDLGEPPIVERDGDSNITALANNSMILNIDGSDTQYLATIPIGTPARNFSVIMDSGSAGNHTFLGENESSTFVNTRTPWQASYGSGNASGEVVRDNVVVAGMSLNNFTFGVAHLLSSEFTSDSNTDGLMGLARSSITTLKLPTPVEELAKRGLIPAAITSYRIPRRTDGINDGEITFGGLDEARFNKSTLVTVNSTDTGFWVAEMGPVTVNGEDLGIANRTALLDTGTTLMAASADDVKAIHDKIPGSKQVAQGYTVPCDTDAVVALTFGGKAFPINVLELARGSASQKSGDCGSGIGVSAQAGDRWLVGDTFLKSVYYSTNGETNEISLARLE